jgi:hypothetical protein
LNLQTGYDLSLALAEQGPAIEQALGGSKALGRF